MKIVAGALIKNLIGECWMSITIVKHNNAWLISKSVSMILIYVILYGLTIAIMKAMLSETSPVENQMSFSR
jgi:hypothetical protein